MSDKRIIDLFLQLVQIDSPSRHEQNICKFLVAYMRTMGYRPRVDKKGNIHVLVQGTAVHGPTILLNAHMDTVVPGSGVKPIIKKDRIVSDGTTVLGSDDKAGIAAILEVMCRLKEQKVNFKTIKIIITVEEEIGLQGAKQLSYDDVAADYCFVLDCDGDVGTIVPHAPAQEIVLFKIKGRAAHAGLNPEDGINAIQIASKAIAALKLGRIDRETTANVGIISGGVATNIIPEEVTVKAEARSHNEEKLHAQVKKMTEAFEKAAMRAKGSVTVDVKRSYNRVATATNSEIVRIATKAAKKLKLPVSIHASGGGSDASVIYEYGVPTIALGIGMADVHSKQEYITLKNLTLIPEYLLEVIKTAQRYELSN